MLPAAIKFVTFSDNIGLFRHPRIREVNGIRYFIDPSVIAPNGSATGGNFEPTANANFAGQVFFASQSGQTGNLPRNFINGH